MGRRRARARPRRSRSPPTSTRVGELRFHAEATREHRQNLVLVRSRYRQPFGTFSGALPDGSRLSEGYGVMEDHDVWW